jgi:ADP-heptose:LPS heptosyltransferase
MKILFITSTRIGDAVLSTGILNHLVSKYDDADITVVCGPLAASLFEGFPKVTDIIALKKEKRHGHWLKLWRQVASTRWDMIVDLRNSAVSRILRAKHRHIFGPHIDQNHHKVEQAAQIMGLSDIPAPRLYFTPDQEAFAEALIPQGAPVIGIGPSANWIGKTWEAEKFIAVLQWLRGAGGPFANAPVAVFAAPGEEAQASPVLESVGEDKRIDCIAKGSPGEVAAAINRCAFYLGNDSGLMHIAAACGVPTVGVFGPSYPHLYAPWGSHTIYARTPETFDELVDFDGYDPKTLDHTLMGGLSPETVIETIEAFLATHENAAPAKA